MRTIHLRATGKTVSVGAYVAAVRRAIAAPSQTFKHGLTTWWPVTGDDVRSEFRAGMHDRINRHDPSYGRGRKWSPDWERAAIQTAAHVNTPRVVVSYLPPDFRSRLAHRLADAA